MMQYIIAYQFGRKLMSKAVRRSLNETGIRTCMNCGYDMRGSVPGVCPKCGEALTDDDDEVIDDSRLG